MATLIMYEDFVVEIPVNGETIILKGQLKPLTKAIEKEIKEKYKERDAEARRNKKKHTTMLRLYQRAENIALRIPLVECKEKKLQLLEDHPKTLNEAHKLNDELEASKDKDEDMEDIQEVISREHIERRVMTDPETMEKIKKAGCNCSYRRVYDKIKEDIEKKGKSQDKN